jgi:hypothetical protein
METLTLNTGLNRVELKYMKNENEFYSGMVFLKELIRIRAVPGGVSSVRLPSAISYRRHSLIVKFPVEVATFPRDSSQ